MNQYRLNPDKTVSLVNSLEPMQPIEDRRVAKTQVKLASGKNVTISTVFLGFDHGYGSDSEVIVFETLVSCPIEKYDGWMARYATYEEAAEGHSLIFSRIMRYLETHNEP